MLEAEHANYELEKSWRCSQRSRRKPKSKANKTSGKQEDYLMASNEANTTTMKEASAHRFLPISSLSSSQDVEGAAENVRKSERIDAALHTLSTGSNPATVLTVPRPKARFAAKGQSQNLGIVMADLGNYTTTASRVLGLGELEDIDFWNGAAAARSSQIRTRVVARKEKMENGTWSSGRTRTWCVKRKAKWLFLIT